MNTSEKYQVYHYLKKKHSIVLSEEQIEGVDLVYKEFGKQNRLNLMLYRLVNFVLSLVVLFIILLLNNNELKWWFTLSITLFFSLVNIFYLTVNSYKLIIYKRKHDLKDEK